MSNNQLSTHLCERVTEAALEYNVDPKLARAIASTSSTGVQNFCSFSRHFQGVDLSLPRPNACDVDTELMMQKTRWGIFGIFGAVARQAGYRGWPVALLNINTNVEYAMKHIAQLQIRYSGDDLISAFNYGAPRKHDGGYINGHFIRAVKGELK